MRVNELMRVIRVNELMRVMRVNELITDLVNEKAIATESNFIFWLNWLINEH